MSLCSHGYLLDPIEPGDLHQCDERDLRIDVSQWIDYQMSVDGKGREIAKELIELCNSKGWTMLEVLKIAGKLV